MLGFHCPESWAGRCWLGTIVPAPSSSSCQRNLSVGGLSFPFSRQLLPILQKLEFGAVFHVPNDIVPGFGQEKTERRESPPPQ